jgi:hypothetical protein
MKMKSFAISNVLVLSCFDTFRSALDIAFVGAVIIFSPRDPYLIIYSGSSVAQTLYPAPGQATIDEKKKIS